MCKLMIMAGIKDETRDRALDLVQAMAGVMASGNDKDGTGYAALTEDGNLFGEKWVNHEDAFDIRQQFNDSKRGQELTKNFALGLKPIDKTYGYFGEGESGLDKMVAITLHTRFATTEKGFTNCHPFVTKDGNTSLIHNGVITNQSNLQNKISTNDSECILNEYLDYDVTNNPELIQNVADKLEGWYAVAVLSKTKEGKYILDIFKDNRASLFAGYVLELDTIVYSTSKQYLSEACAEVDLTLGQLFEVNADVLMRLDPFSGLPILEQTFESEKFKRTSFPKRLYNKETKISDNYDARDWMSLEDLERLEEGSHRSEERDFLLANKSILAGQELEKLGEGVYRVNKKKVN